MRLLFTLVILLGVVLCAMQYVPVPFNAGGGGGGPTITFDARSNATPAVSVTSLSWNHTIGAGTHPALVVSVFNAGSTASTMACTFNSVSMTSISTTTDGASSTSTQIFILANPASGTHSISCTGGTTGDYAAQATSWLGVNQSTPNRTAQTANDGGGGSGSPLSVVVSNALSGDVVIDSVAEHANTITVGSGQNDTTQGYYAHNPNGDSLDVGSSSISATGSTTMTWTFTGTGKFWCSAGFALIPG